MCTLQCHQKNQQVKKLKKQKCPKQLKVLFHITCEIINKSKVSYKSL